MLFNIARECTHLQPQDLFNMAKDKAEAEKIPKEEWQKYDFLITEHLPHHMWRTIQTKISYKNNIWSVSDVKRFLKTQNKTSEGVQIKLRTS